MPDLLNLDRSPATPDGDASQRGRRWIPLAIAAVVAVVLAAAWFVVANGGDGAADGPQLAMEMPETVDQWQRFSVTIAGQTGPQGHLNAGGIAAVYRAPDADREAACPPRIPKQPISGEGWTSMIHSGITGEGPVRSATEGEAPAEPGDYTVCSYLQLAVAPGPSLMESTQLYVREAPEFPALASSTAYPEPGVYAAGPQDIDDAPPGAQVEFEVVAGKNGGQVVKYVAVTELPVGPCDASGEARRESRFATPAAGDALGADLSMDWGATVGSIRLTGGSPGPGTWHGMVAPSELTGRSCMGHLALVARRVSSGKRPLAERLREQEG